MDHRRRSRWRPPARDWRARRRYEPGRGCQAQLDSLSDTAITQSKLGHMAARCSSPLTPATSSAAMIGPDTRPTSPSQNETSCHPLPNRPSRRNARADTMAASGRPIAPGMLNSECRPARRRHIHTARVAGEEPDHHHAQARGRQQAGGQRLGRARRQQEVVGGGEGQDGGAQAHESGQVHHQPVGPRLLTCSDNGAWPSLPSGSGSLAAPVEANGRGRPGP
jgi:hypothetical protein